MIAMFTGPILLRLFYPNAAVLHPDVPRPVERPHAGETKRPRPRRELERGARVQDVTPAVRLQAEGHLKQQNGRPGRPGLRPARGRIGGRGGPPRPWETGEDPGRVEAARTAALDHRPDR